MRRKLKFRILPDQPFDDCQPPNQTDFMPGGSTPPPIPATASDNCLLNGEASLAIKQAAAEGVTITSLVGYSLIWDSLDNRKDPSSGIHANFHQDIAGVGGDSEFIRETVDGRYYYPITDDIVGLLHGQAGQITGFGVDQNLPIINNFNLGPTLVRGFAPGGIGPRDISNPDQYLGQRPGRHHLFRRLGRGAISVVRTAQGTGPEGRVLRRCGNVVRLYRRDKLLPTRRAASRHSMLDCVGQCELHAKQLRHCSTTSIQFAPRSARAFFGRRLSVRSG